MIGLDQEVRRTYEATPGETGLPRFLFGVALAITVLSLTAIAHLSQAQQVIAGAPTLSLASELLLYGNLLYVASALAYVAHAWTAVHAVGKWATGLAVSGVIETFAGLWLRWTLPDGQPYSEISTFAGMTLTPWVAVGVLAYIVMEAEYQTRSTGAMVMPVFAAVALLPPSSFQAANSAGGWLSLVEVYWHYACIAGTVTGYALLAAGAILGAIRLAQGRSDSRVTRLVPGKRETEHLLLEANAIGFVALLLATLLWETRARSTAWLVAFLNPLEPWVLAVLFVYAGHLLLHFATRSPGARTAFWALTNFTITLVGLSVVMLPS